jgi:hypothetical protein
MPTTTTNNAWPIPLDADPFKDGALAMRNLGNGIDTSTGKGLVTWQTYTPVLQFGFSGGNGVWTARYCQIGKTVHVNAYFVFGSTTTKGGGMDVSLPVTASNTAAQINSNAYCSISGNLYPLALTNNSGTLVRFKTLVVNGTYGIYNDVTATTPATWVTGDVLYFGLTYQAA